MQRHKTYTALALVSSLALMALPAPAATPDQIAGGLAAAARAGNSGFSNFSAERGQRFFTSRHGNDWSCASCHTATPTRAGVHAKTGREIAPMAPAANPARFTDAVKVEKWFKRNCRDVLGRLCTAEEKGDVLAYLMSLHK